MKSQFFLAFNEICREKQLPPETVIEALKTALISAYRRNNSVSSSQDVTAEIDMRTGEMSIFAEKEVVEGATIDDRTEVTLSDAIKYNPDAVPGDMVMAESTPRNFGRIAAQTAKQVILQRVREAERDHLYGEFADREDEILNGTVQGISGGNVTIDLGRTEAILPRSQQVRGERYSNHQKIRVYVLEVRKTARGPQIIVSRSHRNLLRRLLELEVPEIYNGQVEIKSIAREAGGRSKIAVQAMQPGVDPVGACVGMRGVRIQNIVRELNDEKIDVIEWDDDGTSFIAKALSPAKVSHVFLDDDPINGRTATVIVPDDQLSLAIGREGQNARLAAKLTNWRIDIKSLTDSARDSIKLLEHPDADAAMVANVEHIALITEILEKKDAARPITADDYKQISRFVSAVEGNVIRARAEVHAEMRQRQTVAHDLVPESFWTLELEELNLPMSLHTALNREQYQTAGAVAYQVHFDVDKLLQLPGFSDDSIAKIDQRIEELKEEVIAREQAAAAAEAALVAETTVEEDDADIAEPTDTDYVPSSEDADFIQAILAVPEGVTVKKESLVKDIEEDAAAPTTKNLDDLSQSLVSLDNGTEKPESKLRLVRKASDADSEEDAKTTKQTKTLILDEDSGKVVSKKIHKPRSTDNDWEDDVEDWKGL